MIVDSHLHLFRHGYGRFRCASPLGPLSDLDAYERGMAEHGIGAGLVVCYEGDGIDPSNNDYVRQLAVSRPWIASVAYLRLAPAPTEVDIDRLLAVGHVGIALYLPDATSAKGLGDWPAAIWERLGRAQAIVSLNARIEAIGELQPIVDQAPGCAFLFAHLGLPGRCQTAPTRPEAMARLAPLLRLASRPHVGVKLSGLYAVDPVPPHKSAQPFVELLLERFAPANLHWGSDFSPALDFVRFEETMTIPGLESVDAAKRRLIFGEALMDKLFRAMGP